MFVRFRRDRSRLQVSLAECRRLDGKAKQAHVAGLGSIEREPMTTAGRVAFWRELPPRLNKLANRIGGDQIKILDAVHARIPMVTIDEMHALQRENAEADVEVWQTFEDLADAEGQKELAAIAARKAADAEARAKGAAEKAAEARERIARLDRGETLTGGLGKPLQLTRQDFIKAAFTESDLRHMRALGEFCELWGDRKDGLEWLLSNPSTCGSDGPGRPCAGYCGKLANNCRRHGMAPRNLNKLGLQLRDEDRGAG
jgi:hypothetical protein